MVEHGGISDGSVVANKSKEAVLGVAKRVHVLATILQPFITFLTLRDLLR